MTNLSKTTNDLATPVSSTPINEHGTATVSSSSSVPLKSFHAELSWSGSSISSEIIQSSSLSLSQSTTQTSSAELQNSEVTAASTIMVLLSSIHTDKELSSSTQTFEEIKSAELSNSDSTTQIHVEITSSESSNYVSSSIETTSAEHPNSESSTTKTQIEATSLSTQIVAISKFQIIS